ncbi:MAG TPA: class I SAM-dependent methyltransferase [Solirubrobacteraceae bacterium]|nr:class I SAM-dependent methyltransferase [Solirubrobacteraceae bacterium]
MDVTLRDPSPTGPQAASGGRSAASVWHDLECGLYRADLPLWRELAEQARIDAPTARILDVGAGTGRVALDLARAGHAVTALDLDAELLSALSERAAHANVQVQTACADARSFALDEQGFALCIAPMQTIQLLGSSAARVAFMARAREHLLPGAPLACAIVTDLESFDRAAGDVSPSPEVATIDGVEYVSRAISVRLSRHTIRIERERSTVQRDRSSRVLPPTRVVHTPETERDVIDLDRVSARGLQREGRRAGLSYVGVREIPATDDHVGSEVVILRA